ncbi:TIGR01457 family HAD-type hydrolase [Paenibacillus sp. CN-4]|uniref:TIGR01457 family HAD-type hydrolase n=1 Tax=Paenibacillus nanchangensis TaxID=3348343 RepID=UPI00397D37A6
MNNYDALLIDLDGTLYHGRRMIPGADELISGLRKAAIPFLFVTNNSSRTPEGVAEHLSNMGIPAKPEEVATSSLAAAGYIAGRTPGARVMPIGEDGLRQALAAAGLFLTEEQPDYVVQGIDRSFNYETLTRAARAIQNGAEFVLTNPDLMLPSDDGLMPGAGTLGAAIEAASGMKPVVIGKPYSHLMTYSTSRLGIDPKRALVVGDNMRTDIAAGVNAGCRTILVLTGVTTSSNLERHQAETGLTADYICGDLQELHKLLSL